MAVRYDEYRENFPQRVWSIARDGDAALSQKLRQKVESVLGEMPPAQVGYIGSQCNGLVFCLRNPGLARGGIGHGGLEENRLFDLLSDLGSTTDEGDAELIFDRLMAQTELCMTGTGKDGRNPWRSYSTFVKKNLDGAGLFLNNVAYINVSNFPEIPPASISSAVSRQTRLLFRELEPRVAIFRYKDARDVWPNDVVPRNSFVVSGISASHSDIQKTIEIVKGVYV